MLEKAPTETQEAAEQLWDIKNRHGSKSIIHYLRGESYELSHDRAALNDVVETLGTHRALQLLSADGEPNVAVYHQNGADNKLLSQLHELWENKQLARYRTEKLMSKPSHETASRLFQQCQSWASGRSITLPPAFEHDGDSYTFPETFAVVVTDKKVRGVYPHSHDCGYCRLETIIEVFKQGGTSCEIARTWDASKSKDSGEHGHLKDVLHEHPTEYFGEGWADPRQEATVGSMYDPDRGDVDLLFRHQDGQQHLLVEAKSTPTEVDKAFGQLLRYKYRFLAERPGLTEEHVELAIAAPDFWPAHQDAAAELGIELVTVRHK
jgi:hypothetical protein